MSLSSDDVKFSARGPAAQVARDVALAVKVWDSSAASFGGVLSKAKCTLSANTPHAANKLKTATAGEGIPVVKEAKDLRREAHQAAWKGRRKKSRKLRLRAPWDEEFPGSTEEEGDLNDA